MSESKSFLKSLAGVVTAVAALVTATGGLIYTMSEVGWIGTPVIEEPVPPIDEPVDPPPPPETPADDEIVSQPTPPGAVEGWAILGRHRNGRLVGPVLEIPPGADLVIGRSYPVARQFRLVRAPPPGIGEQDGHRPANPAEVTLGVAVPGTSVEVLDVYLDRGPEARVYARVRARVEPIR